ncbi:MAG: hypothetical protein CL608_17115 [Anaerolineaceae bacterium]|nr:hypothetical protein [Anaerolineaceae bacterium]
MNREKAIQFVEQNGSDLEIARLRYLLHEERPSAAIIEQLCSGQRKDGGFAPFWAPDYSSIDATCYRLAQAEQLGIGVAEPAIAQATRFLEKRQGKKGDFKEGLAVVDRAPPWAAPGDLAAELYLTANAGFWLAYFGFAKAALQAAHFLRMHLDTDVNKLPSFAQTHWLACGLAWQLNVHDLIESLEPRLYLYARLPQSTNELAWMLTTLLCADYAANHDIIVTGLKQLGKMQQADGRFPNDEGQDVHTTLEALRAFGAANPA